MSYSVGLTNTLLSMVNITITYRYYLWIYIIYNGVFIETLCNTEC